MDPCLRIRRRLFETIALLSAPFGCRERAHKRGSTRARRGGACGIADGALCIFNGQLRAQPGTHRIKALYSSGTNRRIVIHCHSLIVKNVREKNRFLRAIMVLHRS